MKLKKFQRKTRHYIAFVFIAFLISAILSSCSSSPESGTNTITPVATERSSDEACLMIIERLQDLARVHEAREYVSLLFPPFSIHSEYSDDLKALVVTVTTFRSGARQGLTETEWFHGNPDEYLLKIAEAAWVVCDDGRVIPLAGGALLIEADIEQLNLTKILNISLQITNENTLEQTSLTNTESATTDIVTLAIGENEIVSSVMNYLESLAEMSDSRRFLAEFKTNVWETGILVFDNKGISYRFEDFHGQDINSYVVEFAFLSETTLQGVLGHEIEANWRGHQRIRKSM